MRAWEQISRFWQVSWLGLEMGLDGTAVEEWECFLPEEDLLWAMPRMRTVVLSQGLGCICVWKRRCELELFLEAVISLWDFFLAHPISTNFMICLSWHWLSIECSLEPSEKFPLKNCLDQPDLWLCLWRVVLLITWCKRAQPTMDSTSPKAEGFGYLRKLAKHEQGVRQRVSSQAAFLHRICLGSLLKFLPWLPLMIDLDLEV